MATVNRVTCPTAGKLAILNDRSNPINVYADLLSKNNLYHVLYGTATQNEERRAARLWLQALDMACGVAVIDVHANYRIIDPVYLRGGGLIPQYKVSEMIRSHELRIPAIVGIIWHNPDDPTQNEVTFDMRRKPHYRFNPADDLALLEDYKQEIADLLFSR